MEELKEIIANKGLKLTWLAAQLGISEKSLYNKLNGVSDFKIAEINKLAVLLGLNRDDVTRIFLKVK